MGRIPCILAALIVTLSAAPSKDWPGEKVIRKLLEKSKRTDHFETFVKDYNRLCARVPMTYRLEMVKHVQENPLDFPEVAYSLTESVHVACERSRDSLSTPLMPLTRALDLQVRTASGQEPLRIGIGPEEHLDQLAELLDQAVTDCRRAYEPLGREDWEFVAEQTTALTDQFIQHVYLENNPANFDDNRRAVELGGKVDFAPFLSVAMRLDLIMDPGYLKGLKKDLGRRFEGLTRQTPHGKIVIAGAGDDHHQGPVAILIDLGGDDTYSGPIASGTPEVPISVVIDVEGDDTFRAKGAALGCGIGGVGLLVELEGNDCYDGGARSLGCGIFGVGVLIDAEGNDQYEGAEYTQGAGGFGVGALIDHEGKDSFGASLYAQGFGWPRGFGLLWDGEGKDLYSCTGKHPSPYGDQGEHAGQGQGIGIGMRGWQKPGLAAGGIGALLDGGGDDVYRCGQFGLGCGYYFGMGIVRDRGGDDDYESSRYGLATGAHYALGIVLEDEGDDVYVGRGVANQAGNWDLTISYLIDGKGDDSYRAPGLSQGSSTITSLAVLCDANGSDAYESSASNVQGHGGHKTDGERKTRSFGFLLDFGKGKDRYALKEAKSSQPRGMRTSNLKIQHDREGKAEWGLGYFVDSPKKLK